MHLRRRHVTSRRLAILSVAALLAVVCAGTSVAAVSSSTPSLGGAWAGTYSGSYSGNFTIHWTQGRTGVLTGTIALSRPHGTYPINGRVRGGTISFGAVGVGAVYSGSVSDSGASMSGHYKTGDGGKGSWSAYRVRVKG